MEKAEKLRLFLITVKGLTILADFVTIEQPLVFANGFNGRFGSTKIGRRRTTSLSRLANSSRFNLMLDRQSRHKTFGLTPIDCDEEKMTLAERIKGFAELKPNWNGYGALSLTKKVIDKALLASKVFERTGFQVFPTARNSVQFEKEIEGSYVEIEIYEDHESCLITASTRQRAKFSG